MTNNIKCLSRCLIPSKSSVDIKSFRILFFRSNHILLGLIVLAALSYSYFSNTEFSSYIHTTVNYEASIRSAYNFYESSIKARGGTYEQFFEEQLSGYYTDFIAISLLFLLLLLPWLLYFFWPQQCPVRVDKERQLIYTWRWGKLYAARFDALNPEKKETAHFLEIRGSWGPLIISLYPAGSNKPKRVSIGSYIPKFNYQNHQLLDFIRNYLNGFVTIPNDFKPERGFLEKNLVKDRGFPEEEKLTKSIDNWLAEENN